MRKILAMLLLLAAPAEAGHYYGKPSVDTARIKVGETLRVRIDAAYVPMSGGMEFRPLVFESSNERIIEVTGKMPLPVTDFMYVTGLRPGRAQALLLDRNGVRSGVVEVTVVCGREPEIQAATPSLSAKIGMPVLLRAETPIAERTTFTWYRGLVGDMSEPLAASGPEFLFASNDPGVQHAWVMATTPCSSSTAQFAVDVVAPKRRSARH
ncbi:MAG TPA: hypothetical protein VF266_26420 [Thermoanaerobaculia bacterium]